MSLLEELYTTINSMGIPISTGVFADKPPDTYVVLTPMTDDFPLCADDVPIVETQEARISLFTKTNPRLIHNAITRALIQAGITIVSRSYVEYEEDTAFHHYAVDCMKENIYLEGE
jgi:hypothetical protein